MPAHRLDTDRSAVTVRTEEVSGRGWFVRELGAPGRRPVVMVHGAVVSGRYLLPAARELADVYRVLVPDLPGYGCSTKPWPPLTIEGLADALADWVRGRSAGPADLVANSMGCQVVAALAERQPERVRRLVLEGPTIDPAARSLLPQLARFALEAKREPAAVLFALAGLRRTGLRRGWITYRIAVADRIEARLPSIRHPTLVVCGEKDPLVPKWWAERVAALLPRGKLVVLPGAGHVAHYSSPQRFAVAVRRFLG